MLKERRARILEETREARKALMRLDQTLARIESDIRHCEEPIAPTADPDWGRDERTLDPGESDHDNIPF